MADHNYYAVVTFGAARYGAVRSFYRSLARAIADAKTLGGGTMTNVRILGCETRKQAVEASIADQYPAVWHG